MIRQRGMADGWLLLICVVVALGALAGAIGAWKSYTTGLIERGRAQGVAETTAAYERRDNAALAQAIADRNAAQAKADAAQQTANNRITAAGAAYSRGIKIAQANHATSLLAVRAGLDRLCSAATTPGVAGVVQASGGHGALGAGGPGAAGTGDDGLRGAVAERLRFIAAEANRLKLKSNTLAEIVRADRAQINAWGDDGRPVLRMAEGLP